MFARARTFYGVLALGARFSMIRRSYISGLGARGQAGIAKVIGIIRNKVDATRALAGLDAPILASMAVCRSIQGAVQCLWCRRSN